MLVTRAKRVPLVLKVLKATKDKRVSLELKVQLVQQVLRVLKATKDKRV